MAILLSVDSRIRIAQPHVEIRPADLRTRAAGRTPRRARYAAIDSVVSLAAMLGFVAATLASLGEIVPPPESGTPGTAASATSPLTCAAGPSANGAASL